MDKAEARAVLDEYLETYRAKSYEDLKRLTDEVDTCERTGPSGTTYQIEIMVHWDDKPAGVIRVIGAVDDGGWRAYSPLTLHFLVPPDGDQGIWL
jgi:hypothetical protein